MHQPNPSLETPCTELADGERQTSGPTTYPAVIFLVALLLLISLSPILEETTLGALIESLVLTFVLVAAVPAVGGSWRTTQIAGLLALPAIAGKWLHFLSPSSVPPHLFLAAAIIFAVFIAAHHLRFILWAPEVDTQVLCAGVSTFLVIGLLWAFGYLLLDAFTPNAFTVSTQADPSDRLNGFDAVYFSFGMLCGVSFGEITPATNVARMMAVIESMMSLFYFAILISRIVALHTERASGQS
ncbi:potassium channel family protein [Blastopirellula sp. JC732]|uniref:Potassium channel family protein n=1 Tax=Blastopirellula sediminis TaxID=2894196 RepID=A0A9X1MMH5_9BACT|nr:potassium channel family protein [Blastopirellula sediminis]MCC9607181.1 potassium channel family protein [Blastopirellula sediminis]MCC9629526.1 potassium channel family protein [Blastopirellula sediminis]